MGGGEGGGGKGPGSGARKRGWGVDDGRTAGGGKDWQRESHDKVTGWDDGPGWVGVEAQL